MASAAQWLEGARLRTLPLALAPVVAGTGVAAHDGSVRWGRAALTLVVALALQVGVNYANDYSDGVRGTDAERVGPLRLVGSGVARPRTVLAAALASFSVAAVAGLILAALASWWLVLAGALAVAAAWGYTGGARPYGYRALGELAVFVFFGLLAVAGTAFAQTGRVTATAVLVAVPVGLLACAVLVANNLRDIPGDTIVGKRTLAVVLGDRRTRLMYVALVAIPFALPAALGVRLLLVLIALPLALAAVQPVLRGAHGPALVATLRATSLLALAFAVLAAVGLASG